MTASNKLSEVRVRAVRANLEDVRGDVECFDALVEEVQHLRRLRDSGRAVARELFNAQLTDRDWDAIPEKFKEAFTVYAKLHDGG